MRVLIAHTPDSADDPVLRFAAALAERVGVEPTIVSIIPRESDRQPTERRLQESLDALPSGFPAPRRMVKVGSPVSQIAKLAADGGFDLAIIGHRRPSRVGLRWLRASNADRLAARLTCPVAIVKGRVGSLDKVLLCDSGAPSSGLLRKFVESFSCLVGPRGQLTVLHVMSQMEAGPGVETEALLSTADELMADRAPEGKILERDLELLIGQCESCRPLVRHGLVTDQILAEARSGDYDLVVIGAHVVRGWLDVLLCDIAHEIVVGIDRPLLVVR